MFYKRNSGKLINMDEPINGISEFRLEQNSPNPFSAVTTICFSLPKDCYVKLVLYNFREEQMLTLYKGELSSGSYSMEWDGRDAEGRRLPGKNYVYQLEAAGFLASCRLTIRQEIADLK